MNNDLTIIEERIRDLRERNMFTQRELADMMGVSRNLICLWENGYANIALKQIIKFCKIYNVSLDYILGLINTFREVEYHFIDRLDISYVDKKYF